MRFHHLEDIPKAGKGGKKIALASGGVDDTPELIFCIPGRRGCTSGLIENGEQFTLIFIVLSLVKAYYVNSGGKATIHKG